MTAQADPLKGCGAPNPDRWAYGHRECMDQAPATYWAQHGPKPRACIVDGAHIHSWTRPDARYCSARCRMKAMRARKRDGKAAAAAPKP